MPVKTYIAQFDDAVGYDLEVTSATATLQDYLDALNGFQDEHVAPCKGCDNCCWERIPLTSLDVLVYLENSEIRKSLPSDLPPITAFIHRFGYVFAEGPVMDISLRQREDSSCIFLNTDGQYCSLHTARSLVCQTFICLPHSERAGRLRDLVLNIGEDELVRQYLLEKEKSRIPLLIHKSKNALPRIEDYPPTAFSGKTSYRQVLIRDIVPVGLWQELTKKESQLSQS